MRFVDEGYGIPPLWVCMAKLTRHALTIDILCALS
jgi:hypothetical protein